MHMYSIFYPYVRVMYFKIPEGYIYRLVYILLCIIIICNWPGADSAA